MSDYEPIQCGLHDIIEDRIVRRVDCVVVYCVDKKTLSYIERLVDVFSRDGAEFVKFEQGDLVRLDRLLSVDDVDFTGREVGK